MLETGDLVVLVTEVVPEVSLIGIYKSIHITKFAEQPASS